MTNYSDRLQHYKAGMESFYGMGHALLAQLAGRGKKTFIEDQRKIHRMAGLRHRNV